MDMNLGFQALKLAAPYLAQAGGQYFAGKTAENIGNKNESESAKLRTQQDALNQSSQATGDRQAEFDTRAKNAQQGMTRNDQIFQNQLAQSNNRADLQNNMTANNQVIEANRGTQLANNYLQSARDQASASNDSLRAIMGRQVAQYGNLSLR
jgi:hypothetical protein